MTCNVQPNKTTARPFGAGAALSLTGAVLVALLAFTREAPEDAQRSMPVGFTTLDVNAGRGQGRMIPVAVWYPARANEGPRLQVSDYIALADARQLPASPGAREGLTRMLEKNGAPRADVDRWLGAYLGARRDAPRSPEPVPLVLIAAGNDESAGDQAVLAEQIAAHGYVVAAAPFPASIGIAPMASEEDVGRVAEGQADDLAAMVRGVGRWASVDTMHVGVVGHSFGARGALLLAMRNPRVRAVVSLDGGIGSATGREAMQRAPSFAPRRSMASILHVYETLDAWMRSDHALLESLDSTSVWLAQTREMHHHHFTTLGAVSDGDALVQTALGYTGGTRAEFTAVEMLTIRFLDAMLRGGTFDGAPRADGLVAKRLGRQPQ